MKGKFPTIVMAMMALVLALSLAVVGAGVKTDEAEASDLSWSTMVTPSMAIGIYPMVDIVDLALSPNYATDMTMYASVNDPMKVVLGAWAANAAGQVIGIAKSNNGGVMWSACTQPLGADLLPPAGGDPPVAPLTIAVAPDDVNFLAATDGTTIWVSKDGGGTWANYGTAAGLPGVVGGELITSIAVGPSMAGTHPIAVGVVDGAFANPHGVYLWGWGSPPSLSWAGQNLSGGLATNCEHIYDVAFSPNYTSDFTLMAVGSTAATHTVSANATQVHLGDGSTQLWDAASPNYPLWPQVLAGPPAEGPLALPAAGGRAAIALPVDFNGLMGGMQVGFVGTAGGVVNDVWRVRNVGALALGAGLTGVASVDMVGAIGSSAALMVGDTAGAAAPFANLAYTGDPWSSAPWWSGANKAPTGQVAAVSNAIVVLHPDYLTNGEAFCATGPVGGISDESALSKTVDSGLTWNQISLIDTTVDVGIADLAPSPDYATDSTLFVATSSSGLPNPLLLGAPSSVFDSLWKSTMGGTLWERVDVMNVAGNASIIRVSPEYGTDDTIYWAERAGNRIRVSNDGGGFFLTKTVGWAAAINDIAVEDATTLYLASGASVGKSTDGASSWPMMGSAFGATRYLALHEGTGDLFVSGDGIIYYVDTSTMTVSITGQITGEGLATIQWIAFSDDYASDKTIYAAGAGAVGLIWKLTGVAGVMPATVTQLTLAPTPASGIEMSDDGVLYCADPAGGVGVMRSVNPDAEPVTFGTVPEFLRMTQGFASLPALPIIAAGAAGFDSMWMADGTLFVRDTANPLMALILLDRILVYTDTLPMTPSLSSPADGATGAGTQVAAPMGAVMYYATMEWSAVSGAIGYGLQVDDTADFTNPIVNIGVQAAPPWQWTDALSFWRAFPINQPATSYTTPQGSGACQAPGNCATALLVPNTEYFWRVRVDNTALGTGSCVGKWSSTSSFTTGPGIAPDAPAILSPEPGQTGVSVRPGFSWSAVADATQYEFELSDEDGASVVTRTLDGLSYIYDLDDDLDEDATYAWRVRGINTATGFESPWSSATFTTGVPTATPIWVWIMIAIGAVVAIVVIVLIVRTRRPV